MNKIQLQTDSLGLGQVAQLGFLVPDISAGMQAWLPVAGREEWHLYDYTPETLRDLTYLGEPAEYSMRLALTETLFPQIEVIEPVAGKNIYFDWIEKHGYGLHHLGFVVEDIQAARACLLYT